MNIKYGVFLLTFKKTGINLSISFKPAIKLDPNEDPDVLLNKIMFAIEQSEEFHPTVLQK